MGEIPTIETMRLRLRPFILNDTAPMHKLMNGDNVMRYFPGSPTLSLEQVERMLTGQADHWEKYGCGWWAVELKDTGDLIGWCGLQYLPETNETEVAYLLDRDFWGRGLATEAAQASVEWGFAHLPVDLIVAITHIENKASQRVAEKCGLIFDRAAEYFGLDCFVYGRHR